MNKNFTAKTSSKWLLWSLLTVAVFLLGAIVIAITGLHDVAHARNGKTLTVSVPMAETFYEDEQANIENACEKAFADAGLKVLDSYTGEIGTMDHEIVYVFEKTADLSAVVTALESSLETYETRYGAEIMLSVNTQHVMAYLPGGTLNFVLRDGIAAVVFAVLAFAYVSLRYKLWNGILAFASVAGAAMITIGLTAATFIPFTGSTIFATYLAMFAALALNVLFASNNRKAEKDGADMTSAEALAEAVPVCEALKLGIGMLAMALIVGVIGLFAAENFVWFALVMVYAVVAAVYSTLFLVPSLFLVIRKIFAKMEAERSRYDYKKGKKSKKADEAAAE